MTTREKMRAVKKQCGAKVTNRAKVSTGAKIQPCKRDVV